MSFLFPLFLIAGIALAIPVLIHLFNLRRYKTVFFPHTRFLKNIQLNSRRQSQVRYKWLLFFRLLFLASLIFAFAQPFFKSNSEKDTGNRLQVIYLDNSYSMSVKSGARRLLDVARDAAVKQIQKSRTGSKFLLLTNDRPQSYQPMMADKMLSLLNAVDISASNKSTEQLLSSVQSLMQNEALPVADVYYYSDFQRTAFTTPRDTMLMKGIRFFGVPVQAETAANVFVDTAYLSMPVLQTGQTNKLIVVTKTEGKLPNDAPVLQLSVNGQVKSATTLKFTTENESIDTLSFTVNDAGWQQMMLTVNDASVRFDDTFRIAARSAPSLSILVLNEGQPSPYIQAAFRAYNGFRILQEDVHSAPKDFAPYNLVIINGVTRMDATLGKTLNNALQAGQSVCIFPGRTMDVAALNEGLKTITDIEIAAVDTARQAATSLQQGSDLVKDLFEKIPENVQLPTANWHYIVKAGLSANEQSILSFRNGDPFIARYTPSRGQLYICATSVDLQSGNFPGSYFFVPFLYEMAVQSKGGDVYAITAGKLQPAYIPLNNADERNMVHIYGNGINAIPTQRPSGAGLNVYLDQTVRQPGFYQLAAQGSDTTNIGLNADRNESALGTWTASELKSQWNTGAVKWLELNDAGVFSNAANTGSFPLWKVCAILALFMLCAETVVLAGSLRNQTVATQ